MTSADLKRRKNDATGVADGSERSSISRVLRNIVPWVLLLLWAAAVYSIARSGLYTSGSNLGYNLGLIGSLMMLALLLYPLRKRVRIFANLGKINRWFSIHMVLGVLGPTLILLHCTLRWSSLNAAVAFWCMVIVASSGFIGRFLYGRLHVGLYGRQLTLTDVRTEAASLYARARLLVANETNAYLADELQKFAIASSTVTNAGWKRPHLVIGLGARSRMAERRCIKFARNASINGTEPPSREAIDAVSDYFSAARRSAQFLPFERMFSLWHVMHVPLVFILVLCVIAHIIAVHMY